MRAIKPLLLSLTLSLFAQAGHGYEFAEDEDNARFVSSNVIATFYHELGHALVDVLELPVLGREEDAADSLSALLTHQIWDEDSATIIVADTATAYLMYNDEAESGDYETPYWDEHSLDLQRYYNLLCLFYGADPSKRDFVLTDFELPETRAERCESEFYQTETAWSAMLDQAAYQEGADGLEMVGDTSSALAQLIAQEVVDFNAQYSLPSSVFVELAPCGEANAFYNPANRTITLCTEYAEDLQRLWDSSADE